MTITAALPAILPNRSMTRQELITAVDALYAALPEFATQIDAAVAAFNFNSTNSTSTTNLAVASGANKSLTVQAGKSYVPSMTVKCGYTTDPTIWMLGDVITYDSGTGALVFYPRTKNGSGTYALWTISQSPTADEVGDHHFICHTPNGHGSTDNKVRLYTVTASSAGTALTITHSATLGTYATVNEAGDYEFEIGDSNSGGTCAYGVSVNSNQLTQAVTSITYAHRITPLAINVAASVVIPVKTRTLKLVPGDIVRPHTNGNPNSTDDNAMFSGRKVGNG